MNDKKIILCMMYDPKEEKHQCRNYPGDKCEDHKDCIYRDINSGFGIYTLNNFRMELIKSLVDIIPHVDELDTEYKNTLRYNFKTFKIILKIEGE